MEQINRYLAFGIFAFYSGVFLHIALSSHCVFLQAGTEAWAWASIPATTGALSTLYSSFLNYKTAPSILTIFKR